VKVFENELRVWNSLADIKRGTGIAKIFCWAVWNSVLDDRLHDRFVKPHLYLHLQ
jgi:hypothetical protein